MGETELLRTWETFSSRMVWTNVARETGDGRVAREALAELPDVSALEALEANARLVERLVGGRWLVMRDAREAGASWVQIGAALGMSKQGAQDWYRRKIADQEQHAGDLHDGDRAQAVL